MPELTSFGMPVRVVKTNYDLKQRPAMMPATKFFDLDLIFLVGIIAGQCFRSLLVVTLPVKLYFIFESKNMVQKNSGWCSFN